MATVPPESCLHCENEPEDRVPFAPLLESDRAVGTLVGLVLAWQFVDSLLTASRKAFWYDELITLHVSALQPSSRVLQALRAGADSMPPGYELIERVARVLPLDVHAALRLPSILGYLFSLLAVYLFAKKRLAASAGLAAVILLVLSPFRNYAVEARSYALEVGLFAVSAVVWQRVGTRRLMVPLLGILLAMAVSCHYYAAVALLSFGLGELTWTLASRRIRWGVWAAFVFATAPFFAALPILLRLKDIVGRNFWAKPSVDLTISTYSEYLGFDGAWIVAMLVFGGFVFSSMVFRASRTTAEDLSSRTLPAPELVFLAGLVLYPPLLILITSILHGGYTARYGWPAILGLVLGLVYLGWALWSWANFTRFVVALLIALCLQFGVDMASAVDPSNSSLAEVRERWMRLAHVADGHPDIPVVVGDALDYLPSTQYAPLGLRGRLVEVVDPDLEVRVCGSDSTDRGGAILAGFAPLRVENRAPFLAAHREFMLYSSRGPFDWITRYLIEKGSHLSLLWQDRSGSLYLCER